MNWILILWLLHHRSFSQDPFRVFYRQQILFFFIVRFLIFNLSIETFLWKVMRIKRVNIIIHVWEMPSSVWRWCHRSLILGWCFKLLFYWECSWKVLCIEIIDRDYYIVRDCSLLSLHRWQVNYTIALLVECLLLVIWLKTLAIQGLLLVKVILAINQ